MDHQAYPQPLRTRTLSAGPGSRPSNVKEIDNRFFRNGGPLTPPDDAISLSKASAISTSSSHRLPDFFGIEIFQAVLHNPTTSHQLVKFSQARFCGETMEFLEEVDRFNMLLGELSKTMLNIHRNFISPNAPTQISIPHEVMKRVHSDIKVTLRSTVPALESVFTDAQDNMENTVFLDVYPRFVRHKITMSALKAFSANPNKYQGLGDCFVLTNPTLADNPIVYASDGFVSVTGYSRHDIIPRNCRFLQGRQTDRPPVRRLKESIDAREESVELILNYKKNGEPFWNLLYVAPLYNANGTIAFFLGGQINCSTTIHNNSDVFRVLSTSDDVNEDNNVVEPTTPKAPPSRFGFLKGFRSNTETNTPTLRETGMEAGLLNRIDKMDLKKQKDVFYTAYSKYVVVNDKYMVEFYSAGIAALFRNAAAPLNAKTAVGTDIFKFLAQNSASSLKDLKSKVKSQITLGRPISLELSLMTGPSFSQEKFMSHWTPLKDVQAKVTYTVLSIGYM